MINYSNKEFHINYYYTLKGNIVNYAKEIGIASFILLGRLQHDKLIDYSCYNDLKPSFEIIKSTVEII